MIRRRPAVALVAALLVVAAVPAPAFAAGKGAARVKVIVMNAHGHRADAVHDVKGAGGTIGFRYRLIDGFSATVPAAALQGLRHNKHIASVETDGHLELLDTATGDLEYDNAWGVRHIGSYPVHQAGIRGQGVKVAVIDTGLDYIHDKPPSQEPPVVDPEFNGTYQGGYDFVNNDADPMDDNGHGTHVSGILAADHNGYLVVGVAPGVQLWALKVLGASGSGDYSGLIAALDWSVQHDIDVVNISLGGHDVSDALATAVHNASVAGVTIVAAAGNVVTINDLIYGCPVAYPAAYPEAIAVTYTGQNDALTGYSCTGTQVDIAAPGDQIFSPVPVGPCQNCSSNGYLALSGTSMASPHVAGAVALVLSKGIADSNHDGLLSDDVKAHLCATATTASSPAVTDPQVREVVRLRDRQRQQRDPREPAAAARQRRAGGGRRRRDHRRGHRGRRPGPGQRQRPPGRPAHRDGRIDPGARLDRRPAERVRALQPGRELRGFRRVHVHGRRRQRARGDGRRSP